MTIQPIQSFSDPISMRSLALPGPQIRFSNVSNTPEATAEASSTTKREYFLKGLKNIAMIPVFPLVGFLSLDYTGVTEFLANQSEALKQILGEGFGHVGLCFSVHYFINAGKSFWKALKLSKGTPSEGTLSATQKLQS
jgi:hypothetical protein